MKSFRKRNRQARTRVSAERKSNARFVIRPKSEKNWLMTCTALATGLFGAGFLMGSTGVSFAANECEESGSNPLIVTCDGDYFTGVQYIESQSVVIGLEGVSIVDGGTDDAAALDVFINSSGSITLNGRDFENEITAVNTNAIWLETTNGDITVNGIGGHVEAAGQAKYDNPSWLPDNSVGNHGILLSTQGNGNINLTLDAGDVVESDRDAVFLSSMNGNITATNSGTISSQTAEETGGSGIWAQVLNGSGTIQITNNSLSSIYADQDGIHAQGNGGAIDITNGDGLEPNPSGLIDVLQDGIWAENRSGGTIQISNGSGPDTESQIFAGGEYGIYGRSRADFDDTGANTIDIYNFGLVEAWGQKADAAVYGRSSADIDGHVAVYNGAYGVEDKQTASYNARINAYGVTPGTRLDVELESPTSGDKPYIFDANGIELVKNGGFGDLMVWGDPDNPEGIPVGLYAANYGYWDFNRSDNYLTPGFDGPVVIDPPEMHLVVEGTPVGYSGGIFAPGGSAILARYRDNGYATTGSLIPVCLESSSCGEASNFGFYNAGTVIGEGSGSPTQFKPADSDDDPVLDLEIAYNYGHVNFESPAEPVAVWNHELMQYGNRAFIYNDAWGAIGSVNTPFAWEGFSLYDVTDFAYQFIDGTKSWDYIEETWLGEDGLRRFADASDDYLLRLVGAPLLMHNNGLLIGEIGLETTVECIFQCDVPTGLIGPMEAPVDGNFFHNRGAWFVTGYNYFGGGNGIPNGGMMPGGAGGATLMNAADGWIQAAFDPDSPEMTTFDALDYTWNAGVISLLDGGQGFVEIGELINPNYDDRLDFVGGYWGGDGMGLENWVEGEWVAEGEYSRGYFALDAFLAGDFTGDGRADIFNIGLYPEITMHTVLDGPEINPEGPVSGGYAGGSTGLIIRNANPEGSTGVNKAGIPVVNIFGGIGYTSPCGAFCEDGDTFYIAPQSKDYFQIGNVGLIEDGLYAWGLVYEGDYESDGTFELVSVMNPADQNFARSVTGAQDIFYDTLNVVEDHTYGKQFSGAGGGGADLSTDDVAPDYAAPAGGANSGLWVKATGSWTERDTTVTEVGLGPFDTGSSQDTYSILGGADFKPGGSDSPVRIGLFGGYVTSDLEFDLGGASGSNVDYEGGSVGGYAAYNNGAFYVDGTVKGDILNATYHFSGLDVDADVNSVGVSANTGYRMTMGMGFFEPIASIAYVHTTVDDVSGGGGTVDFSNGTSLRAGAGARIGAVMPTGGGTTEISLLGKVWNEFEGDNTVTVTSDDMLTTETYTDDAGGVFGEASARITISNADGTRSGFVSGGGKFGDDFTSWNAQAGVRVGF